MLYSRALPYWFCIMHVILIRLLVCLLLYVSLARSITFKYLLLWGVFPCSCIQLRYALCLPLVYSHNTPDLGMICYNNKNVNQLSLGWGVIVGSSVLCEELALGCATNRREERILPGCSPHKRHLRDSRGLVPLLESYFLYPLNLSSWELNFPKLARSPVDFWVLPLKRLKVNTDISFLFLYLHLGEEYQL